ncbi:MULTISPECIES: hypothetical protein [Romboutsia]|uniref:Uncharacterized protein n=1 Tax=Romboutsia hominis TaxID=1507512 RepID=A0A2P2BS29_9FIRM|nr:MULTISPECIES: hypothetical protein [Romboutsia]MCH1960451.1 hypothetical protein [Romboutsia hominis]MCH1969117.1 hypothetical protein [Romboutsia hominis]MDB8791648.1 hypothetical protein [Romboutsia sp. 1001216sp1]MDB8793389.1 hypothetical protein [Romboutsia sp. 1001216sp1]MDB8796816.1 hypothetical protein [Romboutsia sp. 1001216sp1]
MNYYDILQNFLRCNKNIKLKFKEDKKTLDICNYNNTILSLELQNSDMKLNAKVIYESIINLDNLTIYIPKIYVKEN